MTTITPALVHETVARLTAPGGAFEVSEAVVDGAGYRAFTHAPATLVDILAAGRGHGDNDFLVFGDERWSFRRFFAEVDALACALHDDFGIAAGDRVGIAMRNCPDWLIVFAAAAQLGAIVVPVNSFGSTEELQFTLAASEVAVLAADRSRTILAAEFLAERSMPTLYSDVEGPSADLPDEVASRVRVHPLGDIVAAHLGEQREPAHRRPDDVALLMFTSGSTGHPKGVIYRHIAIGQSLMHQFLVGFLAIELGGSMELRGGATAEAHLLTVPLFHATGLFGGFLMPCLLGHKIALLRKWDAEIAMRVLVAERVTMMSTVPTILKDLLTNPNLGEHDLSTLTRVAVAGAATPADLPGLLRDRLGITNRSAGYGMTETAAVAATMSGPVFDLKPMAAGIPSPITEIRFADAGDTVVAAGREGEVQLRGVTVTPGYWGRDDLTDAAFTADGWLHTGDLGRLDEDGYLHITGRIKEIVIRGGENISPIEIENVAYRHPDVKEVAVFGVPDDRLGEQLAMVCHPRPGSALTTAELREHLRATLPAFKVPEYVTMSDTPLPRNASEKIHRLALKRGYIPPTAH